MESAGAQNINLKRISVGMVSKMYVFNSKMKDCRGVEV